jgi:hypothetical protein
MRGSLFSTQLKIFLVWYFFQSLAMCSVIKAQEILPNRTILIQLKIDKKEFEKLNQMKIEFASKFLKEGTFAIISQTEMSFLKERNFDFKKIKKSKNKLDLYKRALYGKTMKLIPIYHTYGEIIQKLNNYEKEYPGLFLKRKIGQTSQFQKDIWAVKISKNVHKEKDEPAILFSGGIHSCELAGVEICMTLIDHLLLNYEKNQRVKNWVDKNETWFIPVINVDGHHVVTENIDPRWRKNVRDNNRNGILYEYNVDGVDLNRNFDFNWAFGGSAESDNGRYRGEYPFSESECVALRDLALEQKFLLAVTYHSQGEVIFYPWDWRGRKSPDDKLLTKMANGLANSIKTVKGDSTYKAFYGAGTVGQTYPWLYGVVGTLDLIVETGLGRYIFPADELKNIVDSNLQGAFFMLDQLAGPGLKVRVTDETTGEPLNAEIWFPDIESEDVESRFSHKKSGLYFRLLKPGKYRMIVRKENYQTKICKDIEVTEVGWTRLNIQLRRNE